MRRRRVAADRRLARAEDAGLLEPIFSRVSPRYSVWSMSMLVTTAQSVSITLTASRRPPRPTSRITASSPRDANRCMIASVVNSKYVSETGSAARAGGFDRFEMRQQLGVGDLLPFTRARSLNSSRCGDVCSRPCSPREQDRLEDRAGRALAVGAADRDDRAREFELQRGLDLRDAGQAHVDADRVSGSRCASQRREWGKCSSDQI
jgi:hypothetical protein